MNLRDKTTSDIMTIGYLKNIGFMQTLLIFYPCMQKEKKCRIMAGVYIGPV